MSESNIVLNPILLKMHGVTKKREEAIKKLHLKLDILRSQPVTLEALILNTDIQYEQQRLWGFAEDCNYHQWSGIWEGETINIITSTNKANNQLYLGAKGVAYRVVLKNTPFHQYHELLVEEGKAIQIPAPTTIKAYKELGFEVDIYYCKP